MTDPVSIPADAVKRLREETGAGMMDCKRALVESGGDVGGEEKAGPSRLRDFQLAADGADCAFLDFAMPRDRRNFTVGRVFPDGVVPAFANLRAAVGAEMTLQVEPFHEAAS